MFGYFDPVNIFFDNKKSIFFGVTSAMFRLQRQHCCGRAAAVRLSDNALLLALLKASFRRDGV